MRKIAVAAVVLALVVSVFALQGQAGDRADAIQRGAPIAADAKSVTVAQLLETPEAYQDDPVVVEGVISKVCRLRGCWMNLSPEAGGAGVHVTFEGFSVPRDSKGRKARVAGVARVKTEDGVARISFVATGVQLWE